MAMKMVEAGGLKVCTDNQRRPDEDNPKGYYEVERVKNLRNESDKSWLREARGKAIKVISSLLPELPPDNFYKVVFLNRDLDEVIASQNKMLERRGEPLAQDDEQIKEHFRNHLQNVKAWLKRQPNFEVLEVNYREVVQNPAEQAAQIQRFLGRKLDTARMAAAIDPALYRNRAQNSNPTEALSQPPVHTTR